MKQRQCTVESCKFCREMEVNVDRYPGDLRAIMSLSDRLTIANRCLYCCNFVGLKLFVEKQEGDKA